jgi:hypothetical protein
MFMRIYTTQKGHWLEDMNRLLQYTMPAPPVCRNLKNCEFYPDEDHFPLNGKQKY